MTQKNELTVKLENEEEYTLVLQETPSEEELMNLPFTGEDFVKRYFSEFPSRWINKVTQKIVYVEGILNYHNAQDDGPLSIKYSRSDKDGYFEYQKELINFMQKYEKYD
jgi:hypothetical protein